MPQPISMAPGTTIRLADFDPDDVDDRFDKPSARQRVKQNAKVLDQLGHRLYAENQGSILLILQGMDASGKDGTIRAVTKGFNPQSCQVVSFKQPSQEELDHDFLWRIHAAVPRRGNVVIFNRSHYEDVLVVRVHRLVPQSVWEKRYDMINAFEYFLAEGKCQIVKCFLHISKEEQRQRLQERLEDPEKNWKFSRADLAERRRWDDYTAAYEDALTRCNTAWAPWYIIPANRNWYRDVLVSDLLRQTLERMDPQLPQPKEDLRDVVVE